MVDFPEEIRRDAMTGVETVGALTIMYFVLGILKFVYWVVKSLVILTVFFLFGAFLWISMFGIVLPPG